MNITMRAQTVAPGPTGAQNPVRRVQLVAILGDGNQGVSQCQIDLTVNTSDNADIFVAGQDYLVTINPT